MYLVYYIRNVFKSIAIYYFIGERIEFNIWGADAADSSSSQEGNNDSPR